jgi:hypothetical protein
MPKWKRFTDAFIESFAPSLVVYQYLESVLELFNMKMVSEHENFYEYCSRFRNALLKLEQLSKMITTS